MPTENTWQQWLERLYNLRRDKRGSHERPHKPVLLLAILDLLDRGHIKTNEIALTPQLVKTFRRYFDVVRRADDQPSIENPFYFLSGDGFWKVEKPGEGPLYQPGNASSPPSMCAACGLRVRLNDGFSLVEAAHLIPFNVTRDDKPDNGLALCPNHHRAMDRFLIAPCPDSKHRAGMSKCPEEVDP